MSIEKFGKAALRIGQEIIARAGGRNVYFFRLFPRIFPQMYNLGVHVPLKKSSGRVLLRIGRIVLRNNRLYRPFTSLAIERHRFNQAQQHYRRFNPYIVKNNLSPRKDVIDGVNYIFQNNLRYNDELRSNEIPERIDAYELGPFIGQGCNGAVYAAKLADHNPIPTLGPGFNDVSRVLASENPTSRTEFRMQTYPFAVKLMFNYEHDVGGDAHLWRSMGFELSPYPKAATLLNGRISNFKPLPSKHPNIVRVMTAFVDTLRIMPDAKEKYPDALHTAGWYDLIPAEPKTIYIVMRRYRQTLKEYVETHHRNYWTGRVMMAQLLEACSFLYDHHVAQRDMKSDNILLQFDEEDEIPQLVVADFGCALACGSWKIKYDSEDLGGNLRTRSPEVINVVPGPDVYVDFRLADTWAAGGLCYEIFTRVNPFYKQLSSANYMESELPKLPTRLHFVARDVVRDLLKRDPNERVLPRIAANAVNLSLFRFGNDVKELLEGCGLSRLTMLAQLSKGSASSVLKKLDKTANFALDRVLAFLTAETITSNLAPQLVSRAERQLRATFLSRVARDDIWESLRYFFNEALVDAESLASLSSSNVFSNGPRSSSTFGSDGTTYLNGATSGRVADLNGIITRIRSK